MRKRLVICFGLNTDKTTANRKARQSPHLGKHVFRRTYKSVFPMQ